MLGKILEWLAKNKAKFDFDEKQQAFVIFVDNNLHVACRLEDILDKNVVDIMLLPAIVALNRQLTKENIPHFELKLE